MKPHLLPLLALLLAAALLAGCGAASSQPQLDFGSRPSRDHGTDTAEPDAEPAAAVVPEPTAEPVPEPTAEPTQESSSGSTWMPGPLIEVIDGITYVNGILIANKTYALPADYDPGFDPTTQAAFDEMAAAAASEGLTLYIASGYRSYDYQDGLYQRYVNRDGQAAADRYSARAGHSEHQTGLALDLNSISDSFANTPEGQWVAEHCHEYGFILRYPADKEEITGYKYEPWHLRYLGKETAAAVAATGLCLEEYLGIDSVYAEE